MQPRRFAAASFCGDRQLARYRGRYREESASADEVEKTVTGAAHFESGLQTTAVPVDAFGAKQTDTRRATCVGFLALALPALYSRLPHFSPL